MMITHQIAACELDLNGKMFFPASLILDHFEQNDMVFLQMEGSELSIAKRPKNCVFCNDKAAILRFKGNYICQSCIESLVN